MDSVEFLRQMSAQAKHDIKVPKTKLGIIDFDFDTSTYPQVLPKVVLDGEGLSGFGFVCLDSYTPVPGDRVVLLPHSGSYVILGCIDAPKRYSLTPGQLVLRLRRDVGQTISHNTETAIRWNAEDFNPLGFWNPDDTNDVPLIRPTIPGLYTFHTGVQWEGHTVGVRSVFLMKNSSSVDGSRTQFETETTTQVGFPGRTTTIELDGVEDTASMMVYQNSGTSLQITSSGTSTLQTSLEVFYSGPASVDTASLLSDV